jgi:glycosyltransferase involved in cell wall biosynthesis
MSDATRTPPSPQNILYIHSSDDLYGADVILLQLVRGLDRKRFTPIVLLPGDMQHVGLLSRELANSGIEYHHLPIAIIRRRYLRPSGVLAFLWRLVLGTIRVRRLIYQRNIDLIHGFTLAVTVAPVAAAVTGTPLIMHVHEIVQRPQLFRKLVHVLATRWSNRVLCVSEAVRRNILQDQPAARSRVKTVYNGIPDIALPRLSLAELRREAGVSTEGPLVGMLGRISPWKGQQVFLAAAARVLRAAPTCNFLAMGGVFDGETQHLELLVAAHANLKLGKSVVIASFNPNAREIIPAFDILVLPSTSPDPFPTVILEAMSAGISVIATAHGGALEMIIQGETGLLVTPNDPEALSTAILSLLEDQSLRVRLGKAGRERMLANFELSRYLKDLEEVYSAVLNESSNGRTLDQ